MNKNLSNSTVQSHLLHAQIFYNSGLNVKDFLLKIKKTKSSATYKNYLATLKILFRDYLKQPELIQDYKFPKKQFIPRILPSKPQLRTFFNALPERYKVIFLALASSGLRVSELLSARIDATSRMMIPQSHDGSTKHSWVSFYNKETEDLLRQYKENPFNIKACVVAHTFNKVSKKTGINIIPKTLRSIFAREMSKAGVADRYIDAFCGRTPQSVLARHYSDFSPEVLKEIYDKAGLKILND
ncbi:Tyrosine recombinase XerA [uncultured archaeon]|nr:Tyrosine recombinase XerA [uncultured archaeon]